MGKKRHFLHQLKEKGVIDHLFFSIFMESEQVGKSEIKFGGYDQNRIEHGHSLALINTVNSTTWALNAKEFIVGAEVKLSEGNTTTAESFITGTRYAFIEPSSPFIYIPPSDFFYLARQLQKSYLEQGMRCTYSSEKLSLGSSCRFEKPCSEVHSTDTALF
jgi:hypothetical protein